MGLNLIPNPFNPASPAPNLGPPDVNRKIDLVAKSRVRLIGLCYHASYLMAYHWVMILLRSGQSGVWPRESVTRGGHGCGRGWVVAGGMNNLRLIDILMEVRRRRKMS
jgi:hypothetical protein